MASSLGMLVMIHDCKTKPKLNGNLGLVLARSKAKGGTCVVRMLDQSEEEVPACNMTSWIKHAKSKVTGYTVKQIYKLAEAKKLVVKCRGGALLSPNVSVLEACYYRINVLPAVERLKGGYVEMLVQSIDAHQHDEERLDRLLGFLGGNDGVLDRDKEDATLAEQLRDRALAAGLLPRVTPILDSCRHTDRQKLLWALSILGKIVIANGSERRKDVTDAV